VLSRCLTDAQFFAFGWRLPFLASAVLVLLGLYVRLSITETPVFEAALKVGKPVGFPIASVFRHHSRAMFAGILVCMANFVLFYLMTVFALSWGTTALHYPRSSFLLLQMIGVLFFGLTIPMSAWLAERGRKPVMFCGDGGDCGLWTVYVAIVRGWPRRRSGHDGDWSWVDGIHVWAAGNGGD